MVISYEDLFNLMKEKLVKHSCPEDLATRAARNMASSSCDGVLSHGVYRFERLITMIDSGFVKPANRPSLERSLGALLDVDCLLYNRYVYLSYYQYSTHCPFL